MQTINIKSILFIFLFLVTFQACEQDGTMTDEEAPQIELISPTMNDMFKNGDTLRIHAVIRDNDELHDISAKITHTRMGVSETVWNVEAHSHEEVYTIQEDFIIDVSGEHNDFKLEFTVSDHNGNVGTKEFHFHVM